MKLTVLDVSKFVAVNALKPVTDPIFFEAGGAPTPGGLLSAEIFGRQGSEDRQRRWGYIDLQQRFLHPLVYKTLTQLDRKFPEIVSGDRVVTLTKGGGLREVGEGETGWTGIDGVYDNWERIDWGAAEPGSQRGERVGLLRALPKKLAFVDKWPVMPAMYRDVDTSTDGRVREIPPINYLYSTLLTSAPPVVTGLSFADGARRRRAQETLLELHRSSLELIAGKRGLIQDTILGKYADWGVRGILSGPTIAKTDRPDDQEVPFGYVGIPLYMAVNMFQPFVIKSIGERLRALTEGQERVLVKAGDQPEYLEIPRAVRAQLGPDLYKKWISRYMRSQENRLDPLEVEMPSGKPFRIPLYDAVLGRPTTLTDLFYIIASVVTADKHIMFTRYPVEDFRACHFAKLSILTTERTQELKVGETTYPRYPVLQDPRWVDSVRINNSYTSAMGADYDGDAIRLFGLFTQEANAEAERMIFKPTNFCDGQGNPSRQLKNEGVLTLYSLTK